MLFVLRIFQALLLKHCFFFVVKCLLMAHVYCHNRKVSLQKLHLSFSSYRYGQIVGL